MTATGVTAPGRELLYSSIVERPKLAWPNDAKVALWVAFNIEHYQYQPPKNPFINAWPRVPASPDTMLYSYYDYANRVGFWRMLEVLDRYEVPVTASLNVAVLDHYPEIREAILERGWAIMCHGIYNTEYLFGITEEDERALLRDAVDTVQRWTSRPLRGLLGPAGSTSPNTMRLMVEAGFNYSCDWAVDDQPFPIDVESGRLVGVPYGFDVNDDAMMALGYGASGYEVADFLDIAMDQFAQLYEEGAHSGRVMCIGLHGYVFGHPHRIDYLDRLFEYLYSHDGVWHTTADAIADHYLAVYYDDEISRLRG